MYNKRGVITICKERKMGGAYILVRIRIILVLSSLALVPRLYYYWKVGGGRGGGGSFLCICCLVFGLPVIRMIAFFYR